jgi:hypothetical protein
MSPKVLGQLPEGAGVLWHHPPVFKDLMGLGRKSEAWNRLESQTRRP